MATISPPPPDIGLTHYLAAFRAALPAGTGDAVTAEYAGSRGFFWEAHDGLYENQDRLGLPLYRAIVLKHGLSREEFDLAMEESSTIVVRRIDTFII